MADRAFRRHSAVETKEKNQSISQIPVRWWSRFSRRHHRKRFPRYPSFPNPDLVRAGTFRFLPFFCLAGVLIGSFVVPPAASADNPFTANPLGTQKVLVIPMRWRESSTSNPCPDASAPCSVTASSLQNFGPPRHTPAEWESILNNLATRYWMQTTYNQTTFEFTVIPNPDSDDGWWPAPHSFQQYTNNCQTPPCTKGSYNFTSIPPNFAFVPDVTASVVQRICSNPFLCLLFPSFNRLVVINNAHQFGGQTNDNDVPVTIPIGAGGQLIVTASSVNEDLNDVAAIAPLLHELGHQLGIPTHYGDCSNYIFPTPPPATVDNCTGTGWEIMGLSYSDAQLTGYSRVNRGWIDPASTLSIPLIETGPFSMTVNLRPLEVPPAPSQPNVIRLSVTGSSFPQFLGTYIECRERINGDEGVLSLGGVNAEGLLVTDVHEVGPPFPAGERMHVDRALAGFPNDAINQAALQPGQTFTSPEQPGVTIRFNGYVRDPKVEPGRLCSVSLANDSPLPPPRPLMFSGALAVADGQSSISADIALDHVLLPEVIVRPEPPVEPPWIGHGNVIFERAHNRGTTPVQHVQVDVSVTQPAVLTDLCGAAVSSRPTLGSVVLPLIWSAGSAVAALDWRPDNAGSIGIDVTATGPVNHAIARSRFAFQFHPVNQSAAGLSTEFAVATGANCSGPRSFFVAPAVRPAGWQMDVRPQVVTLNPGQAATVAVFVKPPANAEAGAHAEIPIQVGQNKIFPAPSAATNISNPGALTPGQHRQVIDAITILASVVGPPAAVGLRCPSASARPTGTVAFAISGTISPAPVSSPVIVEYTSPSGQRISHVIESGAGGTYTDAFTPNELGRWSVQARWEGDAAHEPVESTACTVVIRKNRRNDEAGEHGEGESGERDDRIEHTD